MIIFDGTRSPQAARGSSWEEVSAEADRVLSELDAAPTGRASDVFGARVYALSAPSPRICGQRTSLQWKRNEFCFSVVHVQTLLTQALSSD